MLHSVESEQMLIATSLHEGRRALLDHLLGLVAAEDFFVEHHGLLWNCIRALAEGGKAHDPTALLDYARSHNLFVGGVEYITDMMDLPLAVHASDETIRECAKRVKDFSTTRRFRDLMIQGAQMCEQGADSIERIMSAVEDDLANIRRLSESSRTGAEKLAHVLDDAMANMERIMDGDMPPATSTGYERLDEKIMGLSDEDFVILAARPSMGKTAAMNCLARNGARGGRPALVFSLEMKKVALGLRMLARESRLPLSKLRRAELHGDDWNRIHDGMSALSEAEVYIDDTPGLSMREIRSRARSFVAKHGKASIYVDYLQIVGSNAPGAVDAKTHASDTSRGLKALARELGCPVVALSQLNRSLESRANKRPLLSDLRDSGSLEQDADIVMFLYRDEYYNPDTNQPGVCEWIIAKQRDGEVGTVPMGFTGALGDFYEIDLAY
ncbi:MAG TPA: replicative DNA helicase [Xanthomonadales bacterium]|nr:replicative DNA helicase [Xanthomonadales bacterium]